MEIISKILARYDTDKEKGHSYGRAYDTIFSEFNRLDNLNIVEIGVQKGESLLAWREYFPNSRITGVDVLDEVSNKNKSINYVLSDIKDWKIDEKFDIIVDDGSHYLGDVVHVVSEFSPKLNKGGVLVIEDVRDHVLWINVIMNLLNEIEIVRPKLKAIFQVGLIDLRISDKNDNFLVVIKRQ